MLAKDPGDRFASGREFHEALAASLADVSDGAASGRRYGFEVARQPLVLGPGCRRRCWRSAAIGLSASPDAIPDPDVANRVAKSVAKPRRSRRRETGRRETAARSGRPKPAEAVATPPPRRSSRNPKNRLRP
jgi:hypothetical protein